MTGFIRGLFGGKKKPSVPKPRQEQGTFFLDEDEAKTFGDIDYMRSSKVVKRTFARKKGQTEELESVRKVSAIEKVELREDGVPTEGQAVSFESVKATEAAKVERRQADSSMDMFRNMAKDLKKK